MLGGMLGSMMGGMVGADPNIMQTIRSDPGLMRALANPKVMIAIQDIMKNKANYAKYENDEDVMRPLEKLVFLTGLKLGEEEPFTNGPIDPPPAPAPKPDEEAAGALVPRADPVVEPPALPPTARSRKVTRLPPAAPKVAKVTYDLENWADMPWYLRAAEISGRLAQKGFCILKGGLAPEVRERAVNEAARLKESGGFARPPREVLGGLFGEVGSAWTRELSDPGGDAAEGEGALREVDTHVADIGMEIAGCAQSYFGLKVLGRTVGVAHCSRAPGEDARGNPPLRDAREAGGYLALLSRRKIKVACYAGPGVATLTVAPIGEEGEGAVPPFRALLPAGAVLILRGDACRCAIDPKSTEVGLIVDVDFLAEQGRDRVPPPRALYEWYMGHLQAIVDNDVTEEDPDVPRELLKLARQTFFKNRPVRVLQVAHNLPTLTLPAEEWRSTIEAASMGGNDCIVEVPASKWDHSLYFDEDPSAVDDFKMYTRHIGVVDHGYILSEENMKDFGVVPAEAATIDPRHVMLCESSTLCLGMADMTKEDTKGRNMGIFSGISGNEMYYQFMSREAKLGKSALTQCSNAANVNRLSYLFDSRGPTLVVDTDDSSGSAAMDTAAMYVRDGRCDFAVAGGVEFIQHPFSLIICCASGVISKTSRPRVFDEASDGTVKSEGVVSVLLEMHGSPSKRKAEKERNEDYGEDVRALITGSALNSKGLSSSLTAPSSPAILDVIKRALQEAQLPGSILDGVEMNASGRALPDMMELGMMKRALGTSEDLPPTAVLRNFKCAVGDSGPPAGLASLARACLLLDKAVHGPCIHLNKLFDVGSVLAGDGSDEAAQQALGRLLLPTELMEARNIVQTVGVTSLGSSGTNVHHVLWGRKPDDPAAAYSGKPIHWFPATSRAGAEPRADFYIVGSWTAWERAHIMEPEAEGVYSYAVTLGENCWETFQIWVDADRDQVLHPPETWAEKDSPVLGPSPNGVCGRLMCWAIDGRAAKVRLINKDQADQLKDEKPAESLIVAFQGDFKPEGHEDAKDISDMPLLDMNTELQGAPGDQYVVRLYIHGKYRRVEWAKLPADAVRGGRPEEAFTHTYFVVGDHNYWTFNTPMQVDPGKEGVYTADIQLLRDACNFHVVRDRDWDQIFFPSEGTGPEATVCGPDGAGLDEAWRIDGKVGDIYRVEFQRSAAADGAGTRSMRWELLRNSPVDFEAAAGAHRYFLVGSWSDFSAVEAMDRSADGRTFTAAIQVGASGRESFQILLDGNWLAALHPAAARGSFLDADQEVVGPDNRGRNNFWVVGRHADDAARPGDTVRVVLTIEGGLPKSVTWARSEAGGFEEAGCQSILDKSDERH